MDPLSLTASIIAVLGAARKGYKALETLNKARKGPREIGELLAHLHSFQALLEKTNHLTEESESLQCCDQLREPVQRGGQVVDEINKVTQQTWPSVDFLKLSEANRQRVTALRNGSRLKALRESLQRVSLDLTAALSLSNASSSVHLVDAATVSAQLQLENTDSLTTLLRKVTFIEETTRQIQETTGKLVIPFEDYLSTVSRLDLADSASGASIPTSMAITLTPDRDGSLDPYDGPRRASDPTSDQSSPISFQKHGCAEWCSCRCHVRSTVGSPWILRGFLGQLFFERESTGPPCNENSCQRSAISTFKVIYHLPRYLVNRYIKFAVQHSPLDGPNLSVRMPRVMEWQHELFKYANVGNLQAIQNLFSEGKASPYDVNPRGSNALIYAAAHGNPRLGQFLLQAGADAELTDSSGRKPVELFCERTLSGQFDDHDQYLVKSMFKDTSFMETWSFTPLHKNILGFVNRDLEDELTVSTASINDCDAQGRTALCWATIRDDRSAVTTLLAFGADPNISDYTGSACLHYAGSAEVCRALLDKKADIHARNRLYSRTALHSFCKRDGPVEMIDLLVQAGLEVDARDADGETPLLNSIFRGFTAAARKLLDLGADPNACNISSCESSAHFAVGFDRHEILPLLFQKGVDYTATNIRGRNIGHMAARVASARTIQILSSNNMLGLDLSLKDTYGNTAADYLSSRKLISQSDHGVPAAFAELLRSCGSGKPFVGPKRVDEKQRYTDEIEAQGVDAERRCRLPGAYPEPAGQQDHSKEEIWKDTVASFRCNYKSPCCYVFDAPRGVCSGVISYQSHGQVS